MKNICYTSIVISTADLFVNCITFFEYSLKINEITNFCQFGNTLRFGVTVRKSLETKFFFFNEIECKKGRTKKMQPIWISKGPCITKEKDKLIKRKDGGVSVCAPGSQRLEDYSRERRKPGESSNSLNSWR